MARKLKTIAGIPVSDVKRGARKVAKPAPTNTVRRGRGPSAGTVRQPSATPTAKAAPVPIAGIPRQEAARILKAAAKSKAEKPTRRISERERRERVANAGVWNGRLGKKGFAGYSLRNMYSAPGLVERANYEGHMERLWPEVRRELGLPKSTPMPKFSVAKLKGAAARVYTGAPAGERSVIFDVNTPYQAQLRPSDRKYVKGSKGASRQAAYARRVPTHEWAHVFQAKPVKAHLKALLAGAENDAWLQNMLIEGGAEAFSRMVARKTGVPVGYKPYPQATKFAKSKGARFIRKGQFR